MMYLVLMKAYRGFFSVAFFAIISFSVQILNVYTLIRAAKTGDRQHQEIVFSLKKDTLKTTSGRVWYYVAIFLYLLDILFLTASFTAKCRQNDV